MMLAFRFGAVALAAVVGLTGFEMGLAGAQDVPPDSGEPSEGIIEPTPAPPEVPQFGAYFGAYVNENGAWEGNERAKEDVEAYEAALGRRLDIDQHYYSWTDRFPGPLEDFDREGQRLPLITWEAWGTSLGRIVLGKEDEVIRARARDVAAYGSPLFLRWGHEMNGDWYPWSGSQSSDPGLDNGPVKYVAAWRHIHGIFEEEGATNVAWVWSPNAENIPGDSWNHWSNYYPGDEYVDWVGPDGYNWGTSKSWSTWTTFRRIFLPLYRDYAARKPLMIAETGSVENGGSRPRWIRDMWFQAQARMPHIKAIVYFDRPPEWTVRPSDPSLASLGRMARSSYFTRVSQEPHVSRFRVPRRARKATRFAVRVPEPSVVQIRIRRRGRIVRRLGRQWVRPGTHRIRWNGRVAGRRAGRGRYKVVLVVTQRSPYMAKKARLMRIVR